MTDLLHRYPARVQAALVAEYIREAEARRQAQAAQDAAYIKLNNTYLSVQRGQRRLTITLANRLRILARQAYRPGDHSQDDYWQREFEKLPRWFAV